MLRSTLLNTKSKIFSVKIHTLKSCSTQKHILNTGCLNFVDDIYHKNIQKYNECMKIRNNMNTSKNYGFRDDTKHIRDAEWTIDELPQNLRKRHVEITGPGNNKRMIINAFNSGADGYMLDLEDSMTPSWYNIINAQHNIKKAVREELRDVKKNENGEVIKKYKINTDNQPTFFVRTRGLHMMEENVIINNKPIPATFFDMATFMYHNAQYLLDNNKGPYLYIPKLELYEEAELINNLLVDIQNGLNIPIGSTKVTCLIETYPAIYQTEEIIYALKDHIAALNCGRWDYLFGMIKSLGEEINFPYRDELDMDKPFLKAYVKQIVQSCHKRNINAIGGMSAFIPTGDKEKDKEVIEKISQDKINEIERGCDGAWVAHPGLVKPIKKLFSEKISDNQIHYIPEGEITQEMLLETPNINILQEPDLRKNINVCLQYISAWLSGNGAVALNGLMEDLATSEISVFQLKQWYNNKQTIFTSYKDLASKLDKQLLDIVIDSEFKKMQLNNQVAYADRYYEMSKRILKEYIYGDFKFLPDVANKYLNIDNGFKSIKWDDATYERVSGSKGYLSGIELTKLRGEYLNKFLYEDNNSAYKFLGTSNGVSAVNVVAGGKGNVGPYAGGWQHNAMGNRLDMCLPDTLHVSPEESANCAKQINNHLHRADSVQHILKLNDPDLKTVDYYKMAMLCDLEQGWCTPEKTRIATLLAIQNGINVIHIEDQGEKKRCGHLGDKELNTYDDYALIMRSANLAAQELLGPEQAEKKWVRFVARTDALSAKRMHYSAKLLDENHPEHKFIDWDKGPTPDGKYLYLKQGMNEDTGNSWGLDLSIYRGARVIDEGLATHVWMETPDADLHVAKAHIDGINDILLPKGKRAQSLYNHSPSFDWDIKFYIEAEELTDKLIKDNSVSLLENDSVKQSIIKNGDIVKGDHLFPDNEINIIGELLKNIEINEFENNSDEKEINKGKLNNIIVERRLKNFGKQLSTFGCNLHLITLPEFHVTAYNMNILSNKFSDEGINAFVKGTQRPERIYSEKNHTYSYYKHQTATGTGVEAAFNEAVGSYDVNTLSDSTEQDDLKKRY